MHTFVLLALFGAAGAVSRYALSGWVYRWFGAGFPYGTLAVNVVGCLLLGAIQHVGLTTNAIPESWRTAISIGFLGALTTFSTFGYETFRQLEDGNTALAAGNVAANVIAGLLAVWLGITIARALLGGP